MAFTFNNTTIIIDNVLIFYKLFISTDRVFIRRAENSEPKIQRLHFGKLKPFLRANLLFSAKKNIEGEIVV